MGGYVSIATPRGLRLGLGIGLACLLALLVAQAAHGHIERPAYWPDPRPDHGVKPAAGGRVPHARSLASALDPAKPGRTRVVCKAGSLVAAQRSILRAVTHGIEVRPTQKRQQVSVQRGKKLLALNERFARRCEYHSLQKAVFDAHNDDCIVVMPGVYTEPHSRKQPTNDPTCAKYLTDTDFGAGGRWASPTATSGTARTTSR